MSVKVSIIVPVYNSAKTLRRCADSILNQDFTDYELFLVDDGSTDDSGAICDESALDNRVHIIHKNNSGVSDTRNTALDLAHGKYIQFFNNVAAIQLIPNHTIIKVGRIFHHMVGKFFF